MTRPTPIAVVAALLLIAGGVQAEQRRPSREDSRPLREARSENGRFVLQLRSGRPGRDAARRPRAVLLERPADGRQRKLWRGRLTNDVAPQHAAIRNDGRFVVTLDEFRRGGAAHAVVIYDQLGKQLREFGLRELLRGDDWRHVTVKRRAVVWLDGASWRFAEKAPAFVITLKWGREITIDLKELTISNDDRRGAPASQPAGADGRQPTSAPSDAIPPEILALLEQPTSAPATQPADDSTTSAEAVAQALENLQRLAAVSELEIDIGGANTTNAGAPHFATPPEASIAQPAVHSNVPQPDPANPVDYMAWVMAQAETDGPSAIPLYEAACEAIVKWEGDRQLYEDALDGDPAALAAPEIVAWLEANRDALSNYRATLDYEYRGWLTVSEDGSVIGIMLPNLANQRQLAKTAIIEARYIETQGDYEAACDIYADNFAIGAQISQGPTLIENLVGIAVQGISSSSLLDSLATDREGVDYAALAQSLEQAYQPTRRIVESMDGERAMVFDSLQRMYAYDDEVGEYFVDTFEARKHLDLVSSFSAGQSGMRQLSIPFLLGAFDFQSTVANTNEYYDKLISAAAGPYQQAMDSLGQLESEVSKPEFLMRNPLLGELLPSLSRVVHLETRGEATRRATILTANLKAYRQKHGDYPPSLDTFGDREMTYDPFTGDRFYYQRDGDNFTLYSLGGNGIDDGGVHDRRADENDYVFWPRPAKE